MCKHKNRDNHHNTKINMSLSMHEMYQKLPPVKRFSKTQKKQWFCAEEKRIKCRKLTLSISKLFKWKVMTYIRYSVRALYYRVKWWVWRKAVLVNLWSSDRTTPDVTCLGALYLGCRLTHETLQLAILLVVVSNLKGQGKGSGRKHSHKWESW